jgi:nucleotide-binding universal stress UspA family protein
MGLKNILVHLDSRAHAEQRLDCALALARQHGAAVTGLSVISHSLFEPAEQDANSGEIQLQELFEQKAAQAGVDAEWQRIDMKVLQRSVADVINHHACFADLVVIGQTDYRSRNKNGNPDLPGRVILGAGRPVLIVPYAGTFASIGERTLVAWKTNRESSRALNDALPLLKLSGQAQLFQVNPTDQERDDLVRLCALLASHEVSVRSEASIVTELGIGDVLLNRIADGGNDLLVMGAYAYTHFGNYVLGDVARHILRHMTVPVIMSH